MPVTWSVAGRLPLNPLRAKLVTDMDNLGRYRFAGHSAIMGKVPQAWQNIDKVLVQFGRQKGPARRSYRAFVAKGIKDFKRGDLAGGGLIRSQAGWKAVKNLRKSGQHQMSDERILGDGVVLGAGAVVTESIPSHTTAVGIPARVIKHPSGQGA